MLPFSSAQLALNTLLCQRLTQAQCHHGRLDVSAPGAYLSLSGQKADGRTIFFWEFGQHFHRVIADYLHEHYDEHTARLSVQVDVAKAEFQYSRLTKQQQAAEEATEQKRAAERQQALTYLVTYRPHFTQE